MSNINRLIKGLSNGEKTTRLLKAIEKQYGYLDSNSPIPNQACDTQINNQNEASCLYFSESAYQNLTYIQKLMNDQAKVRRDNNWEDRPIPFVCLGYKDIDNNYYINNISLPMYDLLEEENIPVNKRKDIMMTTNDKTFISNANIHATSTINDHLRRSNPLNKIYTARIGLLGFTRPPFSKSEVKNCIKLGELAKSTLPGDVAFTQPVISGTLLLTQGCLECGIIEYDKNNSKKVTPTNLLNITRAEVASEGARKFIIPISKSDQPLNGLPSPHFI